MAPSDSVTVRVTEAIRSTTKSSEFVKGDEILVLKFTLRSFGWYIYWMVRQTVLLPFCLIGHFAGYHLSKSQSFELRKNGSSCGQGSSTSCNLWDRMTSFKWDKEARFKITNDCTRSKA